MFTYELRRILKSKIFIILALLSLAYFTYLTVNYYRYNNETVKYHKQESQTVNDYLFQISEKYADSENMYEALKQEFIEAESAMRAYYSEHWDEWMAYADEHNGYLPEPTEEQREIEDRWMAVSRAYDCMKYQFVQYPDFVKTTLTKAIVTINDSTQDCYTIRLNQKAIDKYNTVKNFSLIDNRSAGAWYSTYPMYYEYFYMFLTFAFLILAADVFCYERTRSLEGMVYTSKKGRSSLFTAKLCSLLTIAFAAMAIFTIADICSASYIMGRSLLHEPVQVLEAFQTGTVNTNFLMLILCCNALRFALLALVIGLAAAVSQISRNVFISMIIDLIIAFGFFALYVYAYSYDITNVTELPDGTYDVTTTFDSTRFALYERIRAFLPPCFTNPMVYFEKFDYINVASYPLTRLTTCLFVTIAAVAVFVLFAYFRYGNVLKFIPRRAKKR